jgi:hypothetical protein
MPHKQFRRLTPKLRKRAIYGRKLTHFVDRSTVNGFKEVLWAGDLFHGDSKDFLDGGDPIQQLLDAVLAQRQHIHFQRSFFNNV